MTQLKQQGKGELRDGMGAIRGNVAHWNSTLSRNLAVHHVVTGGENAYEPQVGELRQRFTSQGRLVRQQHLSALRTGQDVCCIGAVVNLDLAERVQSIPREVTGVERVSVENDDFGGHYPDDTRA
jgi:hypothetical protein